MKWRKGPRPLEIYAFAAFFLAAALHAYVTGLQNLDLKQMAFAATLPAHAWSRDWTIVTLSALFSIAFIPVVWILLFSSRAAFWLVTAFTLWGLLSAAQMISTFYGFAGTVSWQILVEPALLSAALVCLWLPRSRMWIRMNGQKDADELG